MWSNIGNVKLHFNCQMASYHAPGFNLQHCKHSFTTTDYSSGGRNGLRKAFFFFFYFAFPSLIQHSLRSEHGKGRENKSGELDESGM